MYADADGKKETSVNLNGQGPAHRLQHLTVAIEDAAQVGKKQAPRPGNRRAPSEPNTGRHGPQGSADEAVTIPPDELRVHRKMGTAGMSQIFCDGSASTGTNQ